LVVNGVSLEEAYDWVSLAAAACTLALIAGFVVLIDADDSKVRINHQATPTTMPAPTTPSMRTTPARTGFVWWTGAASVAMRWVCPPPHRRPPPHPRPPLRRGPPMHPHLKRQCN
jgi:hypothetical protein